MSFLHFLPLLSFMPLCPGTMSDTIISGPYPSRPLALNLTADGYTPDRAGSYYRGNLKVELQIEDPTDTEFELYDGTICDGFRTIHVEYEKATLVLGPSFLDRNPLGFDFIGVINDEPYDSEPENKGYYDPDKISLQSDNMYDDENWEISAEPWDEENNHYSFTGTQTAPSWNRISFDVTKPCADNSTNTTAQTSFSSSDSKELYDIYTFMGSIRHPGRHEVDGWDMEYPIPQLNGSFNDRQAKFVLNSGFELANDYTRDIPSAMFGSLKVSFEGEIYSTWSDKLFLGQEEPEWNGTIALSPSDNDGDDDDDDDDGSKDSGNQTRISSIFAYSIALLVTGMLLV